MGSFEFLREAQNGANSAVERNVRLIGTSLTRRRNATDERCAESHHCNLCRVDSDVRVTLGAPIKSRRDVYTALHAVDFAVLFEDVLGPINRAAFDAWQLTPFRQ